MLILEHLVFGHRLETEVEAISRHASCASPCTNFSNFDGVAAFEFVFEGSTCLFDEMCDLWVPAHVRCCHRNCLCYII